MADMNPIPGGSKPPPQPKKETVRINLPPKPSAAPTIKLPTLPPGGPSGGPAPLQTAPAPAHAPIAAAAPRAGAAPISTAPAQRPMQRAVVPVVQTVSALDRGLAIGAAVATVIALASTIYCFTLFN
jgi:hypothetical protein